MIRIERDRLAACGRTIGPSTNWFQRAEEATRAIITDFARGSADRRLCRQIYAAEEVKAALEKLFHEKCAYCEAPLQEQLFDVDHYRPKGKVYEAPGHPGYYWLLNEWSNLFPACAVCNRWNKDKGTYDDPQCGATGGKGTHFPLASDGIRAYAPDDDLELEKPLLLNPCLDHPEKHLGYRLDGSVFSRDEGERGAETIRIFEFNRKRAKSARLKRLREFRDLWKAGGDRVNYLRDSAPYSGLCRFVQDDPEVFGLEP